MMNLFGRSTSTLCDGVTRRNFLKIGGLGVLAGGLNLSDLLRNEAQAGNKNGQSGSRHKAVINVFLGGGPPHQDLFDLKMDAPVEIRGEMRPIKTKVPGIEICEVFPRLAEQMHHCAVIRSVVGLRDEHASHQCFTGWSLNGPGSMKNMGGRPSIGAVATKLLGPVDPSVPAFVGLAARTGHVPWSDPGAFGYLGPAYGPFKPDGPGMADMTVKGITLDELQNKKKLRDSFDGLRREIDASGLLDGADAATQRAFDVLTSSRLVEALDLSKEDPRVRDRYGDGKPYQFQYDGAPTCNEQFLMARRLIEAGARVITLTYGRWDSHGQNFKLVRDHGGKLDQCLSALIWDLEQRGLIDDVCIAIWGEFGRTPRINKEAGRDHWSQVSCALLAGGGLKTGQVIGATNRLGEYAKDRPVPFADVVATLYHVLGIDTTKVTISDPTGRPQYLVEGKPIEELV
jgi:hypothetical protein